MNTISPGIVITPLARDELEGPRGEGYRRMIELSPDGGVTASYFFGELATNRSITCPCKPHPILLEETSAFLFT